MQSVNNPAPTTMAKNKKSDGFINLKVTFKDAAGNEFPIRAPMFGLDAANPVHAALIANPDLAEHITIDIESIRPAAVMPTAEDINLDYASQEASMAE